MSIMELGALGEFLGSIGVIATLVYLAIQIRQNTRSMDESRRLALAQTYQARSELRVHALLREADSEYATPVMDKLATAGWPENQQAIRELSSLEYRRMRAWVTAQQRQIDNYHYQYQQGLIDEDYWDNVIVPAIRIVAPMWRSVELGGLRPSFESTVESLLGEQEK